MPKDERHERIVAEAAKDLQLAAEQRAMAERIVEELNKDRRKNGYAEMVRRALVGRRTHD